MKISASANIYLNTIFAYSGIIEFPEPQSYSITKRTDTPLFAKLITQLSLPGGMIFEMTGQFFSSKNIGQGSELSRGGIDLGIKKSMAGTRIEFNLSATDILNTMGIRQRIDGQGFIAEYRNLYETQIITLACRYKF